MAFKFFTAFALVTVASAGLIPVHQEYHAAPAVAHYSAPAAVVKSSVPVAHYAAQPVLTKEHEEYDPHPQYKYSYDVQDSLSGDSKSQVEERDGDSVRGEYSLVDADGFKRTVHYTADDANGFNAVVHREPLAKTVAAVKTVAAPVHLAAPAYTTYSHSQPAAIVKAAPVAHYAAPAVVKTVAPAYTTYSHPAPAYTTYTAPTALVKSAPLAHYTVKSAAPAYTAYSVPATYVTHH